VCVSVTPGALLSNSSPPRSSCSRLIWALTAGCVTPSAWAALVKLRASTTVISVRNSSVGMLMVGIGTMQDRGSAPPSRPFRPPRQIVRQLDVILPDPFEHAHVVRHGGASHVEDAGELRILDLHVASLASELHCRQCMHGNAGRADRVPLGLEPARRVDREAA